MRMLLLPLLFWVVIPLWLLIKLLLLLVLLLMWLLLLLLLLLNACVDTAVVVGSGGADVVALAVLAFAVP